MFAENEKSLFYNSKYLPLIESKSMSLLFEVVLPCSGSRDAVL